MSDVLTQILAANEAYVKSFGDKGKLAMPPARRFAILTCMDARLSRAVRRSQRRRRPRDPQCRRAGHETPSATPVIRTSRRLCEWFVIHHTDCGMLAFTNEIMRELLEHSLSDSTTSGGKWKDVGKGPGSYEGHFIEWLTIRDQARSVVADVARIKAHPLVPSTSRLWVPLRCGDGPP